MIEGIEPSRNIVVTRQVGTHMRTMQIPTLLVAFLAGVLCGLAFSGGLWLTVRKLQDVRRPWLLVAASFALRLGLVLATFFLVIRHDGWLHLVVALGGFIVARSLLIRGRNHGTECERP